VFVLYCVFANPAFGCHIPIKFNDDWWSNYQQLPSEADGQYEYIELVNTSPCIWTAKYWNTASSGLRTTSNSEQRALQSLHSL